MRLFISVPLTDETRDYLRQELAPVKQKFRISETLNLVKWVPEENWHFTLIFLGEQEEMDMDKIKTALKTFNVVNSTTLNVVHLEKITYGPVGKRPRMVWVTTDKETSKRFEEIKSKLENALEEQGLKWRKDNRPFNGHITVARIKDTRGLPEIKKALDFEYQAPSINLMTSTLGGSQAKYECIQELSLFGPTW